MRRACTLSIPGLLLAALLSPAALSASAQEVLEVPPARVGDAWSVDALGGVYRWDLEVEGEAIAPDRWGREREVFSVAVDGFHPIQFVGMRPTDHRIYVDAASGTQVAEVGTGVLDLGPPAISEPGAYSAFSPNDIDAWPGWVLAGGLLAGRRLVVGETIELPMVVTRSHGNERIVLGIEDAPDEGGARCVRASGTAVYPTYVAYQDGVGYDRGELTAELTILQCDDAPYARRVDVAYGGALTHTADVVRTAISRGAGEPIGTSPFEEEDRYGGPVVPFDGTLRDGGPLPMMGLEEAQAAAADAPGLTAWRLAHPGGYLVQADYLPPERDELALVTLGVEGERWLLTHADPSGAQHVVEVARREGLLMALDRPQAEAYPSPVPPLEEWPAEVVPPAGAIAAWRGLAGQEARLVDLHWHPLLDRRWHVGSELDLDCADPPCGVAVTGLVMTFHIETGAALEGLHPVP